MLLFACIINTAIITINTFKTTTMPIISYIIEVTIFVAHVTYKKRKDKHIKIFSYKASQRISRKTLI